MAKKKTSIQKHPNLKWLLPILVIAILLSAFIFYKNSNLNPQQVNTSNASISTSDWKTYEDSVNSYSIKYPGSWEYKEVNIEGGSYERGTMLPDESVRFYDKSEGAIESNITTEGNEQLYLRIINNETLEDLSESKGIEQTTIAGLPAVKFSTGAYVEISSSPNVILSISSTAYPSPELEEILNSIVVNK